MTIKQQHQYSCLNQKQFITSWRAACVSWINQWDSCSIPPGFALGHHLQVLKLNPSKRLAERKKWEKLLRCIGGRGLRFLHLDKCLLPSIWVDRGGGKWISKGGKSVDDEYSNLVGHCCLPFCPTNLPTSSNHPCYSWVNMWVCVICKKGQCSSLKHPSTFKGWILCPGVIDTSFEAL